MLTLQRWARLHFRTNTAHVLRVQTTRNGWLGGTKLTHYYLGRPDLALLLAPVAFRLEPAAHQAVLPPPAVLTRFHWWRRLMVEKRYTWSFELLLKFANNNNYVIYQTPILAGALGARLQYAKKYHWLRKDFNRKTLRHMLFGFTTGRCGFKRHQKRTFLAGEITMRAALWFAKRAHEHTESMKLRFLGPSRYVRRYLYRFKRLALGNQLIKVHRLLDVVPTSYNGTRLKARGRKRYRYHWYSYRRFKKVAALYLNSGSVGGYQQARAWRRASAQWPARHLMMKNLMDPFKRRRPLKAPTATRLRQLLTQVRQGGAKGQVATDTFQRLVAEKTPLPTAALKNAPLMARTLTRLQQRFKKPTADPAVLAQLKAETLRRPFSSVGWKRLAQLRVERPRAVKKAVPARPVASASVATPVPPVVRPPVRAPVAAALATQPLARPVFGPRRGSVSADFAQVLRILTESAGSAPVPATRPISRPQLIKRERPVEKKGPSPVPAAGSTTPRSTPLNKGVRPEGKGRRHGKEKWKGSKKPAHHSPATGAVAPVQGGSASVAATPRPERPAPRPPKAPAAVTPRGVVPAPTKPTPVRTPPASAGAGRPTGQVQGRAQPKKPR